MDYFFKFRHLILLLIFYTCLYLSGSRFVIYKSTLSTERFKLKIRIMRRRKMGETRLDNQTFTWELGEQLNRPLFQTL